MKTMKYITFVCALCGAAVNALATVGLTADGTNLTAPSGTTYDSSSTPLASTQYVLNALNGGGISVSPLSGAINITLGTAYSPIAFNMFGAIAQSGGQINLGDNSTISGYSNQALELRGVVASGGTVIANGLTVDFSTNHMGSAMGARVVNNGVLDLGSNSKIISSAPQAAVGTATYVGVSVDTGGSVTATDLTIDLSNVSLSTGFSVVGEMSTVDIGGNSVIKASVAGVDAYRGASVNIENAQITALSTDHPRWGVGIVVSDAFVSLTNTTINAVGDGLRLNLTNDFAEIPGNAGETNIIGGKIFSESGNAIVSRVLHESGSFKTIDHVVNISDGAVISSRNGVLYKEVTPEMSTTATVRINVSGNNTAVSGTFHDSSANTIFSISDNATWASEGSSSMDKLILDNANVELTLTTQGDAITAGDMSTNGMSDMTIDFSNDFLSEITDGFMFDTDTAIIIGSGEKDNINYIIAGQNKDGSTWDVTDNLDGTYTISNINVVPEPATYVAIFGALALALATYRRRK